MASENETIADISNDLRDWADGLPEDEDGGWFERPIEHMQEILRDIADKIDAAWKRERAEIEQSALSCGALVERSRRKPVGNAAAMREALMRIKHLFRDINLCEDTLGNEAYAIADAALSAPPRNCDVGTEQEQQNRFREFCRHYESDGECGIGRSEAACPAFQGGRNPDCSLWWAHMPYEAQEGGACNG